MKKISLLIILSLFTCLCFAQTTNRGLKLVKPPKENPTTEKRKAVVIGMSDYGSGKSLDNTLRDADDMADVFTRLGFEVTLIKNNDMRGLENNLADWYRAIEGIDMAVFYFAGHGVQVNNENYLIPVDAKLNSPTDVRYNALNVNQVLGNMDDRRVGMKLLILDACRDNPFTRSWTRGGDKTGLANMTAPDGTYIAFAAAANAEAADGGNLGNGVFTYYLKKEIVKAGISIDDIFSNVASSVYNHTNKQQRPSRINDLMEIFYFIPPGNNNPTPTPTPAPSEVTKRYYYYVDQNGNESRSHFEDRKTAESEMKNKNLYGKIYSNGGEVFVVEKPFEQPKPVIVTKRNGDTWNPDGIEMVYVEGGTFLMGCTSEQGSDCFDREKPAHQVTVNSYYIGKYPVTQAQWKAVMGNNPSYFKGDNLPVEQVSWDDAQEFIRKLNAKTGKNYRLPTEAEWEFAARGGSNSRGYKYSGSNNLSNVGWNTDNSGSKTQPVGTKQANELGIYDLSGNVWEWCNDFMNYYETHAQTNPQGPLKGIGGWHVYRGGSCNSKEKLLRVSYREHGGNIDNYHYKYTGFRLAHNAE